MQTNKKVTSLCRKKAGNHFIYERYQISYLANKTSKEPLHIFLIETMLKEVKGRSASGMTE